MRLAEIVPLAALSTVAASCGGTYVASKPPADAVFLESEPNDDRWSANVVGTLWENDFVAVEGHVGPGWIDPQDGLAFFAGAYAPVWVRLYAANPNADLDLCVYDPVLDEFVACFESPSAGESGSFVMLGGGGEFQLVVGSFAGSSAWRLEVETGCSCALELAATGEASGGARALDAESPDERRSPRADALLERWRGRVEARAEDRGRGDPAVRDGFALVLEDGAVELLPVVRDALGSLWVVVSSR